MMRGAATIAIVTTRLSKERRVLLLAAAACALLAYLQRYDDLAAHVAGCLVFGTLAGVTVALLQRGAGRFRELELCEQSAPLYGRELARATALVPCIIVSFAAASYWAVSCVYVPAEPLTMVGTVVVVCAATLVALYAGIRRGAARVLYTGLACAVPALAFVFSITTSMLLCIMLALAAGFVALRQYGEALARYDPL